MGNKLEQKKNRLINRIPYAVPVLLIAALIIGLAALLGAFRDLGEYVHQAIGLITNNGHDSDTDATANSADVYEGESQPCEELFRLWQLEMEHVSRVASFVMEQIQRIPMTTREMHNPVSVNEKPRFQGLGALADRLESARIALRDLRACAPAAARPAIDALDLRLVPWSRVVDTLQRPSLDAGAHGVSIRVHWREPDEEYLHGFLMIGEDREVTYSTIGKKAALDIMFRARPGDNDPFVDLVNNLKHALARID